MKISSIFEHANEEYSNVFKLEFVGISTLVRLWQPQNAYSHIYVTLDGIKISSIFVSEKASSILKYRIFFILIINKYIIINIYLIYYVSDKVNKILLVIKNKIKIFVLYKLPS